MGNFAEHYFVAYVMLAGKFVNTPARGCIGDVEPRLRESARRPDIHKRAAATVSDPQAGILRVPTPVDVGIGCMRVVVDLLPYLAALFRRGSGFHRAVSPK